MRLSNLILSRREETTNVLGLKKLLKLQDEKRRREVLGLKKLFKLKLKKVTEAFKVEEVEGL